jgi:uncharacterized protein YndB with AHSA1/START domain
VEGRLEHLGGDQWQLRFVRQIGHSPEHVWRALTEAQHQAAWLPARMEGERRAGAPLRFVFEEAPEHESPGEMLTWDPPRLLEYSWEGELLRFELREAGAGCELTFVTRFSEMGKAARDAAGWHVCLDQLVDELDGRSLSSRSEERWRPLSVRYRALFGPEASTIGPPDWHPEAHGGESAGA